MKAKFEVESDAHVRYIFKSLNTKWTEYRQQLWQQRDDGTHNRDEIIAMCPEVMNKHHWASFVYYRLNSRTKVIKTTLFFEVFIYLYLVILLHVCLGNCQKKNKDNKKK